MRRVPAVAARLLLLLAVGACSSTSATPSGSQPPASTGPSTRPSPVDLSAGRQVWFSPLPPLPTGPGRPFVGSEDFLDLFAAGAPWDDAAARISVFKLYGEWVDTVSEADLQTAIAGIRERGMVLAVEAGPLDAAGGCGVGVEGFAGSTSGRRLAARIRDAGGVLQVVALDEPWYFAHVYDGPQACHWPVAQVAQGVADFVAAVRDEFPWVVVGDIEPNPAPVTVVGLSEWMDAYASAVGNPMAFLHLDLDWSQSNWSDFTLEVEAEGDQRAVPTGIIYTGGGAPSDEQWIQLAGQRALDHEDRDGGEPDHVVFQSWDDHPNHVLPDADELTFTSLVRRYVDDRASLGLGDGGGNLALDRPASASSGLPDAPATNAVDGDPATIWNAGAGPPAWIEIDLGAAVAVGAIRLYVGQSPAGSTEHRIFGRASPGGALVPLGVVTGETNDYQVLELASDGSWPALQVVRIETVASPSWVAWREIEVEEL